MIPIRKGYLSIAIHDEALFHPFLSHCAARYDLKFQTGDPLESLQHRLEAIRILNTRLDDPVLSLSDGAIGTVASLALYELRCNLRKAAGADAKL
jgi:hypothetical protein